MDPRTVKVPSPAAATAATAAAAAAPVASAAPNLDLSAAHDHDLPQPSPSNSQTGQSERRPSITSPDQNANKDRAAVPSACVQCRSKHLKCDGLKPCTRCLTNAFECTYVRSRRGFKGPRRNGQQGKGFTAPLPGAGLPDRCPMVYSPSAPTISSSPENVHSGLSAPPDNRLQSIESGRALAAYDSKAVNGLDLREKCIEAFFFHFYPAHPFVLPRLNFHAMRKERPLHCLEAAIRYVGSIYVENAPSEALGLEAERAIYDRDCIQDGFRVQAMLVLAIGFDGYTLQERALQILTQAQDLALQLGMQKQPFAFMNGLQNHVLEESWRRTWWELYVVDGMIAGVHQKSSFRLNGIPSDVSLPCEEREYFSGLIPPPYTLRDFDDDAFEGGDVVFSSYSYRIASIRNLGRVLESRKLGPSDEATIDRVDAHLVNWRLHLPDSKRSFISGDSQLDEMIFQAHMINQATTVLLHREHSQLDSSVARDVTSCAPHKQIVPGESYNIHAAKTIQAAQDISKLVTLPVPLVKHTHFFTCVVTLASIVHLSCWSVLMPVIHDDDLKQQLRLNTGALKTLQQVWPSAGRAFGQVKGVAQEIFAAKKQQAEVGYWTNFSQEDVMRSMVNDQNIMEELQLL